MLALPFATARSGRPSLLKSAAATSYGAASTGIGEPSSCVKLAWAAAAGNSADAATNSRIRFTAATLPEFRRERNTTDVEGLHSMRRMQEY